MKLRLKSWPANILAIIAGALVTPSLAPFDLWPLGIVSTALLAWQLAEQSPAQAAIRGWFYGLGLFGAGTSWVYVSIHVYGYASPVLAALLTLLFSAGLALFTCTSCYIYARWIRDKPAGHYLGFAALFALGEWWRGWFLTGFPWLYAGYAHLDTPLSGWAPVIGIYGLGFIVALTGAIIANGLKQRQLFPAQLVTIIAIWLTGGWLSTISWVSPSDKPELSVAMVQANIPQQLKWNRDQYWPTLQLYQQISEPLWPRFDLVIWPEAAIPGYYQNAEKFLQDIAAEAAAFNSTLITGLPFLTPQIDNQPRQYYNSVMAFGAGSGTYHKQRLVPFGEYVPLESYLRGLIQFFDLPMSGFSAGPAGQGPLKAGEVTLAPFICYEIVYSGLVAQSLPQADLLITVSNDAWFGKSIGPLQHLQMAQMRALENGRYLLRATGSGISAIINQRGQIVDRGDQFTRQIITGKAVIYSGTTPFSHYGNWPMIVLCFAIGISLPLIAAKMRR